MSTPSRSAALSAVAALALAALAGPLACTPAYHDQDASWEPPTGAQERVRRIFEQADATVPEGLLPDEG
ncbi:MAG: hypothetical protein R3263_10460 [Myxococcota bacterium]|nr:hypothetical protein [Myxococcota bacterium]